MNDSKEQQESPQGYSQNPTMQEGKKRKRGRPIKPMEKIPDTFENVVKSVVKTRK